MWGAGVSWCPCLGCFRSDSVVAGNFDGFKSNLEALASGFATSIIFLNLALGTCSRGQLSGWTLLWSTSKGLILAQNERWRRGLGMQVGRSARGVA